MTKQPRKSAPLSTLAGTVDDDPTPIVRDTAAVTVSAPVDGRRRRRSPSTYASRARPVAYSIKVDPRVWRAARAALRPGTRLEIVSAEVVRVVNVPLG